MNSVEEIKKNPCEICGAASLCTMIDKQGNLRYACFNDIVNLWRKIIAE